MFNCHCLPLDIDYTRLNQCSAEDSYERRIAFHLAFSGSNKNNNNNNNNHHHNSNNNSEAYEAQSSIGPVLQSE